MIPPQQQEKAARIIAETALTQTRFTLGENIALYMAEDGEIDPRYLLEALLDRGTACYLPVLLKKTTTLAFRQYLPDKPLVRNFFGLLEPGDDAAVIDAPRLSTVFMPLVAFDARGNRLGMGKGYYDRTFAFLLDNPGAAPNLVGLAHECQRVAAFEAADWDVPLKGVITDRRFYAAG